MVSTFLSRNVSFWRILNFHVLQGVIFSVLVTDYVQKFLKVRESDGACVPPGTLVPPRCRDSTVGRLDCKNIMREDNTILIIFKDTEVTSKFEASKLFYASEDYLLNLKCSNIYISHTYFQKKGK